MHSVVFVKLIIGSDEFLFSEEDETIELDSIPSIESVSIAPAVIDPGRTIGQRESISVQFKDHLHVFDAEAYTAGTFWTKFRAIYSTVDGATLYLYRGERGDPLADMERRTYIVDNLQVTRNGASITAKDPLFLVLGKAAQAPNVSSGELDSAIDFDDMSLTLTPSGIGNLEYPTSGYGCIGGSEIVPFTRSGDTVTLSSRGYNLGGVGEDHEAGSKFQLVLDYSAASPSEIVYDLLTNYTEVDPSWITLSDWELVDDHIGHLYSAQIAAPESVSKMLDEISEQCGVTLYWDAVAEQLRLISLAPTGSGYVVDENNTMEDSFDISEQTDKRISQSWIYYGQKDVVQTLDDTSNYRRVVVDISDNFADYGQAAIKKVFSRWIGFDNQVAANRLSDMLIARYKIPPRVFSFDLFRSDTALPRLGAGISVQNSRLVDASGDALTISAQIISETPKEDRVSYRAEEINYDGSADTTKYVILDSSSSSINMRSVFDSLYGSVGSTDVVSFIVPAGAIIRGDPFNWAVTVGSWPSGVTLSLTVNGTILSQSVVFDWGGGFSFESVGLGITTTRAISIENNGAIIAESSSGGGAGQAINGISYVTYTGSGVLTGFTA